MADLKFNIVYDRKHVASREKTGVLEFCFSMNGKRKYVSTGIKLTSDQWKNGRIVSRPDTKDKSRRLIILQSKAAKMSEAALLDDNFDFSSVASLVKGDTAKSVDFIEYCELRTVRRQVSEHTKERYRVFTRFLRSWNVIRTFSDVTVSNVRAMNEYLRGKGLELSTVYNYHKCLKLFANDAVIDGYLQESPYHRLPFKLPRGDKQYVDCLTVEQFKAIRDLKIRSPHLVRVRDLFLFQCYTGLAYSDLMAFNFDDCDLTDGKYFYHERRVKTNIDFTIQLLPQALEILSRYNNKLPHITNMKYNDYLKAIGLMVGVPELHSHMGRATAATMFLSKGMPFNVVSKVLGHATLRQTQRYARTLNRDVRSAFDAIEDKF